VYFIKDKEYYSACVLGIILVIRCTWVFILVDWTPRMSLVEDKRSSWTTVNYITNSHQWCIYLLISQIPKISQNFNFKWLMYWNFLSCFLWTKLFNENISIFHFLKINDWLLFQIKHKNFYRWLIVLLHSRDWGNRFYCFDTFHMVLNWKREKKIVF
jgi:hypothetical protein